MTKKDILNSLKKVILSENSGTPGITVTKKNLTTSKKFNDEYYKEVDKKMKDYEKIEKDDFEDPKVILTDEEIEEENISGSGMEGLTYDEEEGENFKKFEKRNDELNKPSKDYYLKKDEINDIPKKMKKAGDKYKEEKKKFHNTPPVRTVAAESTIKRLKYKTQFVNEDITFNLIPQEFKSNNLIFEMTDGVKTYKIRWEGNKDNGKPIVLLFKDQERINEEVQKMERLINYNTRDQLVNKTNVLIEEQELKNFIGERKKVLVEQTTIPATSPTTVPQNSDNEDQYSFNKVDGDITQVSIMLNGKPVPLFRYDQFGNLTILLNHPKLTGGLAQAVSMNKKTPGFETNFKKTIINPKNKFLNIKLDAIGISV